MITNQGFRANRKNVCLYRNYKTLNNGYINFREKQRVVNMLITEIQYDPETFYDPRNREIVSFLNIFKNIFPVSKHDGIGFIKYLEEQENLKALTRCGGRDYILKLFHGIECKSDPWELSYE